MRDTQVLALACYVAAALLVVRGDLALKGIGWTGSPAQWKVALVAAAMAYLQYTYKSSPKA
jgi:hypothetical protein